jgi:hypothetical protein
LPIRCQHLNQRRQRFSSDQQESEVEAGNQDNVEEPDPEEHLFQVDERAVKVGNKLAEEFRILVIPRDYTYANVPCPLHDWTRRS